MGIQLTVELPQSLFSALRSSTKEFVQEMRLAAAVKWYEMQKVSQSKVAEIAGIRSGQFCENTSAKICVTTVFPTDGNDHGQKTENISVFFCICGGKYPTQIFLQHQKTCQERVA